MKKTLLTGIAALSLVTGIAHAQQQTFRDAQGRTVGTATKSGNTTIFRDSQGRTTGTATIDSQGTTIFRDSQGRTTGTTSRR
jgi:YD repeat-containing protein